MWKAIFKKRILLFHQAELFLPYSKRCYHAFQILRSKMENRNRTESTSSPIAFQNKALCSVCILPQQLIKITLLWELYWSN